MPAQQREESMNLKESVESIVILCAYDALWQSLEAKVFAPKYEGDRYKIQFHDRFNQRSGFHVEFAYSIEEAKRRIESRQGSVTYREAI